MKSTIKVQNKVQKVLLDTELFGQFSDGFWENSRNNSWVYLDDNVEVAKTNEKPGIYFKVIIPHEYKGYKVNNTELLSYVGWRMLAKAKIANFFNISTISDGLVTVIENHEIEELLSKNKEITVDNINNVIDIIKNYQSENDFWKKRVKSALKQIDELGGIDELVKALNSSYNMKSMRKDLREITKILKTTFTES